MKTKLISITNSDRQKMRNTTSYNMTMFGLRLQHLKFTILRMNDCAKEVENKIKLFHYYPEKLFFDYIKEVK